MRKLKRHGGIGTRRERELDCYSRSPCDAESYTTFFDGVHKQSLSSELSLHLQATAGRAARNETIGLSLSLVFTSCLVWEGRTPFMSVGIGIAIVELRLLVACRDDRWHEACSVVTGNPDVVVRQRCP